MGARWYFLIFALNAALFPCAVLAMGEDVPSDQRTASMPDSWLVLYNLNDADSIAWAAWYQEQRQIPSENMVGLFASTDEHLESSEEAQEQIVGPVRDLLDSDSELRSRVMGILLGFRLPGSYATPPQGGPGGFSVADALQDMYDDLLSPAAQQGYNLLCPQFAGAALPPGGRITKAQMPPTIFMVARIDAPTLALAKAMTLRAKAIEAPNHYIRGEYAWFDYSDSQFASSGGVWPWLRDAVTSAQLASIPWREFDSDTEGTFFDAFRIDTHDVDGWNDGRLMSKTPGSRIFAYNFNSWGATTVRSTSAHGARFVPNAIAGGYAAALGSTGEPQFLAPFPKIFLACLQEGWTAGEAFFLANPLNDWMWTYFGDPFLHVPNWFDVTPPDPRGNGDINGDGVVDGVDLALLSPLLLGIVNDPTMIAAADMSGDGVIDDDDAFLMLGPLVFGADSPDPLRGTCDVNQDNRVDSRDIPKFMEMIIDNGASQWPLRIRWAADANRDGSVNLADIPSFVEQLLSQVGDSMLPPSPGDDSDDGSPEP